MNNTLQLLIVEDNPDDAELVLAELRHSGFAPDYERVETADAMKMALAARSWDLVLSDHALPRFSAPAALKVLRESGVDIPFVVVSGTIDEEIAVAMMKEGAQDYLIKDRLHRLGPALKQALVSAQMRREQKALHAAYLEVQEHYHHIFENAIEGIYRSLPEGGFLLVNPAMARILGYDSVEQLMAEAAGDGHHGYVEPGRRAEFRRQIEAAGAVKNFESEVRRCDGQHIWVKENAKLVSNPHGGIAFYEGTVEDITARRQVEEERRRLAAAMEQAAEAVVITDLDGSIVYVNPAFEKITGYSRTEAIGRNPRILKSGRHDAEFYERLWTTLLRGEVWRGHFTNNRKDGTIYEEEATVSPVRDVGGKVVNYVAVKRDVTHEAALEAQLRQAQRLESLGALASGLAHDLNNVLAPVLMAVAVLRKSATSEVDRKMIATLEGSAHRGAGIVRQVLTFARGIKGERVPVKVRYLLRDMVDIATETFPPAIRIDLDAPKDLWPVIGDATQLHQIVMNLCINARDAMPHGGAISIAAENLQLDEAFAAKNPEGHPGPWIRLRVTDTGTGIPVEIQAKIFEPFFTTKEPGKGTGLGLATVLGITKNHGGFIRFNSAVGRGTCFEIYLPAAPSAEVAGEDAAAAEPVRGAGQTVLIVDDEPAICSVTARILESFGYQAICACDGTEAMAVYVERTGAIAAVITDMVMPGMDGPTLVRTLRRINPRLPILGITGFGESEGLAAFEALGLPVLLRKPFAAAKLLSALADALRFPPGAGSTRAS